LPILIELVFVSGAVLLFTCWQLQEIKVDQRKAVDKRAAEEQARAAAVAKDTAPVPPPAHVTAADPADRGAEGA
jgi:hypothetical protein